jgi:hypothetical protein
MNLNRNHLTILCCAICLAAVLGSEARASIDLGDAYNYGVLYEGNGGQQFQFNNSFITGNVGIGNDGTFKGSGSTPIGTITGNLDFSAGSSGQFNDGSIVVTGSVNYGVSAVTSGLNTANSLSQALGLETGTSTTITGGMSLAASNGNLVNGNRVFTVTGVSFAAGTTFTINGSASDTVILNITKSNLSGAGLNGSIVLTGGISTDNVIINLTPDLGTNYNSDYTSLTGGPTLTISTNGATTTADFLDPTGNIQVNHSLVDGRLIGGDTQNLAFVSGANLVAPPVPPPPPTVPEPMAIVVWLGLSGMAAGAAWRSKRRPASRRWSDQDRDAIFAVVGGKARR